MEGLTKCHPEWHTPWGQLGYALVDRVVPDWKRAKECLDRAVDLRGNRPEEGYYYNRLRCAVQLDPNFARQPRQPADPSTRDSVPKLFDLARNDLGRAARLGGGREVGVVRIVEGMGSPKYPVSETRLRRPTFGGTHLGIPPHYPALECGCHIHSYRGIFMGQTGFERTLQGQWFPTPLRSPSPSSSHTIM